MANDADDQHDDESPQDHEAPEQFDDDYDDDYDDEYDDDYDDEYDDDYDDDEPVRAQVADPAAAAKKRRDTYLVIGAAALILIAVVVIVVKGSSNKNDTGSSTTTTTVATSTTTGAIQKVWQDDSVNHPPKGIDGKTGLPTSSTSLKPGIYWWSDFFGWHVRMVRGDGVSAAKIEIVGVDPNPIAAKRPPASVTVTNPSKSDIVLDIPAGTDQLVAIDLDINGFNDRLTWKFDGISPNLVWMGSSANPIGTSPYNIQKIQKN